MTPEELPLWMVDAQAAGHTVTWRNYMQLRDEFTRPEQLSANHPDADSKAKSELWLIDYLNRFGSVSAQQIKADAKQVGISQSVLKRAALALGVTYTLSGFPARTTWSRPAGPMSQQHNTNEANA